MLVALVIFAMLTGFFLGVITLAGVFAYLVRQDEMEKRLDIDMPREKTSDERPHRDIPRPERNVVTQ